MHANPSTAHACAPTNREELIRQLTEGLDQVTGSDLLKINAVIDAILFHEVDGIEDRLANQETCPDERAIILPLLEQIRRELGMASFKPLFTKQQIINIESTSQKWRDSRLRIALSTLCMTEKRLINTAFHHKEAFEAMYEAVESFVDDSKAQLGLAEAALSRLLLVSGKTDKVQA